MATPKGVGGWLIDSLSVCTQEALSATSVEVVFFWPVFLGIVIMNLKQVFLACIFERRQHEYEAGYSGIVRFYPNDRNIREQNYDEHAAAF